jgi:putative transposase
VYVEFAHNNISTTGIFYMTLNSITECIKQCFFEGVPDQDSRATIQPIDFVSALVFGFLKDSDQRSLANLRMNVIALTQSRVSRSTFWERMATKKLFRTLSRVLSLLMARLRSNLKISKTILGKLQVKQIFILDSTSCSLPKRAKHDFPAPRNNVAPAAIKAHTLMDIFGNAVKWFELTPATTHDSLRFPPISMLKGCLILFDLGYWDFHLLKTLIDEGVFFLTRVRTGAAINIVRVVSGLPKKKYLGARPYDHAFHKKKSEIVEVIGEYKFRDRSSFQLRLIGFWNSTESKYHWYVTNLRVPALLIYPLYRLRWAVEILFKSCKGTLHLDEITTSNKTIIHNLIFLGLIAALIAGSLSSVILREAGFTKEIQLAKSIQRASFVLTQLGRDLFDFISKNSKNAAKNLIQQLRLFAYELFDPNYKHRETSIYRVYRLSMEAIE